MGMYIGLIVFVLLFSAITKLSIRNEKRSEQIILIVSIVAIFFLLALKKETVGIDIAGYKEQYELSRYQRWGVFDFIYFEVGYTALMMIFAKIGIGFQLFVSILYAVFCTALYLLIKNYSKNVTMSILIVICYQFLVFSISGLRQMLAMSICIFSYILSNRKTIKSTIISIVMIIFATLFHESAVVFFIVPIINLAFDSKIRISIWAGFCVFSLVFRVYIWKFVTSLYGKNITAFEMGGNFLFLLSITMFLVFTYVNTKKGEIVHTHIIKRSATDVEVAAFSVRVAMMAIICYIIFSGGGMLRANMYFTMFLIPSLPSGISQYDRKSRLIMNIALGAFLLYLFYKETLVPNALEMCPYRFFWQ